MKRYVSAKRSAAGATAVTVSLVDGEISRPMDGEDLHRRRTAATATADEYAHRALDEIRLGLEPKIERAS